MWFPPEEKPVVLIDQDRVEVGGRVFRIHVHGLAPRVHAPTALPEPRSFAYYGLERRLADWELSNLDLARTLDDQRRVVDGLQAQGEEAIRAGSAGAAGIGRELALKLQQALFKVWAYQSLFRIIPLDGSTVAAAVRPFAERLEYAAAAPRAQWILKEAADRPSVEDQLYAMLGKPGVTNGVVELVNVKRTVTLKGKISGSLMLIVGPGGVVLDGVDTDGSPDSLLTLHARSGRAVIKGKCRAIVTLGRPLPGEPPLEIDMRAGSELRGALLMARLPEGAALGGTLVSAATMPASVGAIDGATRTQGLFAAVSPRILYQTVTRR
jgi:hypothetical protein